MLLLFTFLLLIILISRLIEKSTNIPSTLSIIILSFLTTYVFPDLLSISKDEFNDILYLMLPVILLPDILNLSIKDLKKHTKIIFYLAVVAVILSIAVAVLITPFLMPEHKFTIGMLIALFTMLMATDAITVASIMSKFKLPNRLKIYAEYESLFNDVTALIIFYFIALPLINEGSVSIMSVNITLLKVLLFSTVIGIATAYIGYLSIKILRNPFDQFIIIYLVVIISFLLAEYFHIAGILSIVASVMTFKYLIQKDISQNVSQETDESSMYESIISLIKKVPALTKKEFRGYKKEAMFIGVFANAIVFVIVAIIIDFSLLLKYHKEILIVFMITTIIRMFAMHGMIIAMKLPKRWAKGLTYSGAKGALAVIMVHSLPNDFIYLDMFEAIIIGNVLLTTFIYTFLLMYHINKNSKSYEQDILAFDNDADIKPDEYKKSLVNLLEKDETTNAYNKSFINDIINKELSRAIRYRFDVSLITFKIMNLNAKTKDSKKILKDISNIINKKIRTNDYFGKLSDEQYLIITPNTSLSGALVLAEKTLNIFENIENINSNHKIYFGITQAEDTDDLETIYERLDDALERGIKQTGERIEIEV